MADPWGVKEESDPWAVKSVEVINGPIMRPAKRTVVERFKDNAVDAYRRGTLLGAGADAMATSLDENNAVAERYGASGYRRERNRSDAEVYQSISKADPWYHAPGNILDKAQAGIATLGGQLAGSIPSPESLLGVGKGSLVKQVGANAVINAAADVPTQGLSIASGAQDKFDPWRVVASAALGGALPVAARGVEITGRAVAESAPKVISATMDVARGAGKSVSDAWGIAREAPLDGPTAHLDPIASPTKEFVLDRPAAGQWIAPSNPPPIVEVGAALNGSPTSPASTALVEGSRSALPPVGPAATPGRSGVLQQGPALGDLWKTPRADLERMLEVKSQADRGALVKAFGSEEAAGDFQRLDRASNSANPTVADAASRELEAKFGALTPEQERLVYGIGEDDIPQADDIRDVLREHRDLEGYSESELIDEIATAIRDNPRADDFLNVPKGTGSSRAQAQFVRMGGAFNELSRRSGAPQDLAPKLVTTLVDRGYGKQSDVAEIIGSFLGDLRQKGGGVGAEPAPRLSSPENPRLFDPASQVASPQNPRLSAPRVRPIIQRSDIPLEGTPGRLPDNIFGARIAGATGIASDAAPRPVRSGAQLPNEAAPLPGPRPVRSGSLGDSSNVLPSSRSVGGLRQALRPGAVPAQGGHAGRSTYAGDNVATISHRLKRALGATVRQGRMTLKGNAVGEFHSDTGVIRTKAGPEINVVAHEIGHALETRKLPSLARALNMHSGHLKTMAYPGAAAGSTRQEGFAEFFRWYVTNPDYARKIAPGFMGDFENAVGKDAPQVLADLRELQGAYKAYLEAPSSGVVSSNVVTQKPRNGVSRYADAYKQDKTGAVGMAADDAFGAIYDRFHPVNVALRQLRKIAAANGQPIGDLKTSQNPYRLARMASGSYAAGHMNIMQGVRPLGALDPTGPSLQRALQKALGKSWKDEAFNDFGAYLISRRMRHEWRRYDGGLLKRPPDMLSPEAHAQTIKDFEAKDPKWVEAAGMVTDWANELWKKRYDAGLISQETYLRGAQDHPDYVPAQRDLSDKDGVAKGVNKTGKFSGGANAFKGSDRPFINPLQSLMRESYELEALVARNEVLKSLQDVAERAGTGSGAIVEKIPAKELKPFQVDAIEAANEAADRMGLSERDREAMLANLQAHLGDEAQVTMFQSSPINERGEPIVYVWRDGERIPLRLPDGEFGKQMFDAIAGMTPPEKSIFLDAMAAVSHVQRFGITTNPAFTIRNYFRDQISAWMLTDIGFKPFITGARGVFDELRGAPIAKRYNALGGLMGGANVSSIREARNLKPRALATGSFTWAGLARGVAKVGEISETGTRLGIFRNAFAKAKREGLADFDAAQEAIFEARDYFDTDLHGSRMLAAKRILPFFNANMQGMRKAVNTLTAGGQLQRVLAPLGKAAPQTPREKAEFLKAYKLYGKMAALGVAGASLTALYLDDPEYAEFDEQERATHWLVKGPEGWIKLPKPFELASLSNVFERVVERYYGKDPTAWKSMRKGLAEILLPPVQTPLVTIPYEQARNKDYGGRPIVPEHLRGKVDPVLQANAYTSELGRLMGRLTNSSPAMWDHAIAGFFGTWGRDVENLSNRFRPNERPARSREDAFVLSAFRTTPERGTSSAAEFWDLMAGTGGKLAEAEGSFRQHIRSDNPDAAIKYLAKADAPTRDYILSQVFSEGGSGKIHPLERARLANTVLADLRRDLSAGGDVLGVDGRPIKLSPTQRRDADKALSQLTMAELSNGLKGAGVKGWKQREYISRKPALNALNDVAPPLKDLLSLKMAAEKVPSPAVVAKHWPELRERLNRISDGEMRAMLAKERAESPSARLDEALKRRGLTQDRSRDRPAA